MKQYVIYTRVSTDEQGKSGLGLEGQERTFISERTKAALKAAKAKGKQLGGLRDKTMKRNEAIQAKAKAEAVRVMRVVGPLRQAGETLASIAITLNDTGVAASRGGSWTATQVARVLERASAQ